MGRSGRHGGATARAHDGLMDAGPDRDDTEDGDFRQAKGLSRVQIMREALFDEPEQAVVALAQIDASGCAPTNSSGLSLRRPTSVTSDCTCFGHCHRRSTHPRFLTERRSRRRRRVTGRQGLRLPLRRLADVLIDRLPDHALGQLLDPESPLRWTCKSTHALSAQLFVRHGIRLSRKTCPSCCAITTTACKHRTSPWKVRSIQTATRSSSTSTRRRRTASSRA